MINRPPVVVQHHIKLRLDQFQTKCNQRLAELMDCLSEYVNELAYQLHEDLQHDGEPPGNSGDMMVLDTYKTEPSTNGDQQQLVIKPESQSLLSSDDEDNKDFDYFGDNDAVQTISDDEQTEADRRFQKEFMRHITTTTTAARNDSAEAATTASAGNNAAATERKSGTDQPDHTTDSDDYFRTFEEEAAARKKREQMAARAARASRSVQRTGYFESNEPKPPPKPKKQKRQPRTEPRPVFNCDQCSFTASSRTSVVTHRRAVHRLYTTSEKLFECDICAKRVCTKLAMEAHMRTHTGDRPLMCEVCCERFNHVASLQRHKRGHDAIREFKCQQCDKAYFQKQDLKVHMQTHTGVRPQKCPVCARGFWKRFHVLEHLQKVHGVADATEAARIYPPKVAPRVYVSRSRKKPEEEKVLQPAESERTATVMTARDEAMEEGSGTV